MKYLFTVLFLLSQTALADSFIDPFFYTINGTCANSTRMEFYELTTSEPVQLGQDQQGRPAQATLGLQLFKDGTYWAKYGERAIKEVVESGPVYAFLFEKRHITGRWVIEGEKLFLENLGEAVASKYEAFARPYPSLKVTLKEIFNDSRALGKKVNLTMQFTKEGPRGQYVYQYCQGQH